ncbi:MAG TPA: ATP-dependent RNA helicase HrpA, partial [Steroidobacteraceae bacterium]|nr:ATP-dependent RNA helicase HrpA [Steroidobacteraceae bacterium]
EGICIRLFSEDDFNSREDFTPPEVLRTNLASVILRLAVLGLGEPESFPFLDPPDTRLINDGYRLLQELKAVDADRGVTSLGRQVASLPVDPRLARMLIAASHHACLAEMLIVTSFLEIQDPRERPADAQTQADQAHATFADPRSDFVAILNLWKAFQEKSSELSGNQLRKWCRETFLSFVRMREWQELHRQLEEAIDEIGLRPNQVAAEYADLHQAILTGFLGSIGQLDEKRDYLGARGTRFTIAPGTPLATKPPKWIVAGSIVETTRVFARMVASVEPQWIESAGAHLLKRSYTEPHWVEQRGFVAAFESLSLYGLLLAAQRRVNYGSVAPKEAREIFVREALVEGRSQLRAEFLRHNAKLRAQVESMEAKIRRRDILVDEHAQCTFYLERIPEHVNSVAAMEKWLKEKSRSAKSNSSRENETRSLLMTLSDLARRATTEISPERFPDTVSIGDNELALTYRFEPGIEDDGVTLTVPEPLLGTLNAEHLTWFVPGWHLEIITELLRALPKEQRKQFVPVPEAAARCYREIGNSSLSARSLAEWVTRESGMQTTPEQMMKISLPEHLRLNVRVVQLDGCFIAQGRDLNILQRDVRKARTTSAMTATGQENIFRAWDFGDLPIQRVVERQGVKFTVYPAIAPQGDGVVIAELGSSDEAEALSKRGLLKLAMLALQQQVKFARQEFKNNRELILLAQAVPTGRALVESFVERVFMDCFIANAVTLPRTRQAFDALLDVNRARIGDVVQKVAKTLLEVLQALRTVRRLLVKTPAQFKDALADINRQLESLLPSEFLIETPDPWLEHLPRYLRAIARRLERLPANAKRDVELMKKLAPLLKSYGDLGKQPSAAIRPEFEKLRWMIEEYRVSLFAQDLKTSLPVSDKRVAEQVQRARDEASH